MYRLAALPFDYEFMLEDHEISLPRPIAELFLQLSTQCVEEISATHSSLLG